jgi:integrase/recombinase XerC
MEANKLPKRPFERGEPEAMFRMARKPRDKAMLVLFWRGGLRINEARHVRVEDCEFHRDGSLRIHVTHGKGGKTRFVGFGPTWSKHIKKQIARRKTGYVMQTRVGGMVDPTYLRRVIRNIGKAAAVKDKVHPHRFRHTCARDLHDEDFSVLEIQTMLGHQRLDTTQIYLQDKGIIDGVSDKMMMR